MVKIVVRDSDQVVLRFGEDAGSGETNRNPPLSNVPADFRLGHAKYTHSTQTVVKGLGAYSALKLAAIAAVEAALEIDQIAAGMLANVPQFTVSRWHDLRLYQRQHVYLVLTDTALSTSIKTRYLTRIQAGPQGLNLSASRASVYSLVRAVSAITTPTSASHWVNPATGARVTLQNLNTKSGSVPATLELTGSDWVYGLSL